ncbi:MAG: hypothetical protein EXR79_03840 [Myxococcales bacterium]|nr:hypothetical protein [Myxococcales bacterium]
MTRAPTGPPRGLAAGLRFEAAPDLDPAVLAILSREGDGLARALAAWGRFRQPVRVRTTTTGAALRAAAPCPTDLNLHGLAGLDELVLLAPAAWLEPPADGELVRTLHHELAHVLLFQRCATAGSARAPWLPTWFREGMATVASEGRPPPRLRRHLGAHPALDDLPGAGEEVLGAHAQACYDVAALAFQDWYDRFGGRGLTALCAAMRAGHSFAAAFTRACGQPEATWLAGWLAGLRRDAGQR